MVLKRNTQVGKNNFKLIYLVFLFYFCLVFNSNSKNNLEGVFTNIKILDKISSKNTLLKLENGKLESRMCSRNFGNRKVAETVNRPIYIARPEFGEQHCRAIF